MKQFEDRVNFQGSAQSQGFSPVNAPDVTPLLRQNMETEQRSLDNSRRAGLQQFELNKLTNLAAFSETLSNTLVEQVKQKNQADEEAGLMLAYTDGIPEPAVQQFEDAEKTILQAESGFKTVAATAEADGAPVDVVRQFRNLGGWKAYGYARGMAEQAAAGYSRFYASAAENTAVNINGQEVTLATAKTSPERAAVEAQIRNQYLRQFVGFNPALLNKYLFPAIRQYENKAAADWAETQQAMLKEERKTEAQDTLYTGIKAGRGGETLIEFINRFSGDFGGVGNSRKVGIEILENLINSRQIGQEEVDAILNHEFEAKDGSMRKVGEYWGRDFTKVKDLLFNASRTELQQELTRQQDSQSEFKLVFDQQTAERRSEGRDWSEAELRAVADDYEAKGLGPAPDWLKNYMSKEDRQDDLDKERLLDLRRSRGYLTEEDLRSVSATLYSQMIGYVKEDKALSEVPKTYADEAKAKIAAFAAERHKSIEGSTDKTPEYVNAFYNAQNAYDRYYRENIRSGYNQADAHIKAIERVEKNFDKGTYSIKPTSATDQQARMNYARASSAWSKDTSLVNTAILPGTERDLAVLEKYAQTGQGKIPLIYYQLAQGHRNLTAWDIANAQLQAAGKGSLLRPRAVEYVDQQDPQVRALFNWRPTAARANRAAMMTEGYRPLLDLVASKESTSYGGYDAMNTGGAAGGTVAYGSANSKNLFGRGLSQMSVAEVMNLQASNKVHAAGRYQIIGSTLKDLIQNGAATPNDRFDASTQDKLAVALARRRLARGNAMVGLRNEWIGLRKVPDAVLQRAVAQFNNNSPFNDPQNLLPRLVYKIGSRGYGSTGPHLDVKPVKAGTMKTDPNLPPITKSELDKYVTVGPKRRPLSQGTVTTDDDRAHRRRSRSSFGHDFAAPDGTPVFLANGARVVGSFKGDGGTDHTIIELPDGRRYQFLHGVNA
jgi:hypothetical protein